MMFEPHAPTPGCSPFADIEGTVHRVRRPLTPRVAAALTVQNARFAPSAPREAHLAALRSGAAAVVTGQQVGLFLGPVFNIYKAASAVAAARTLAATTGVPVVPVFWLQSEDHDLVEIAQHHTLGAGGVPLSLHLPADAADRRSLAHHILPAEVEQRLDDMRVALTPLPHGEAHVDRLAHHYVSGRRWVDAFAGLLAELFADDGLVLIDARDPAFASAQIELHRLALTEAGPIASRLVERSRKLAASGRATPVHVRPGAPLSFFHPEGAAGPRFRLEPDGDGWREVGGSRRFTTGDLLQRLDDEPLAFSTSALLRPILQDTLLPTALYVGGATEVAYFAQIPPLYEAFGRAMPAIIERAGFRVVGDRCARLLSRWGLEAADCEATTHDLIRHAARQTHGTPDVMTQQLLDPFLASLDRLAPQLTATDPDLQVAVDKTRATVTAAVARLTARYERSRFRRNEQLVADVGSLLVALYPDQQPQERFYGLSGFAARYGETAFLAAIRDAIDAAGTPASCRGLDLRCDGATAVSDARHHG